MEPWRTVQGWNTDGARTQLTVLLDRPASVATGRFACEYHVVGLLRRSPPKQATSAPTLREARHAAKQAAVAEIGAGYVEMCRH